MAPLPLPETAIHMYLQKAMGNAYPISGVCMPAIYANRGTFTCPVYQAKGKKPIAVFRLEAGRKLVRHETTVLLLIAQAGLSSIKESIPSILWHGTWGSRYANIMTHLKGKLQTKPRTNRGLVMELNRISNWLTELYAIPVTQANLPHRPKTFDLYRSPETLGITFQNEALAEMIFDALLQLSDIFGHDVLCHADLHPGNILVYKNRVHVLDWEYADLGLPIFDWFYYLCTLLFEQKRNRPNNAQQWIQCLESIWHSKRPQTRLIRLQTANFLSTQGISESKYPYAIRLGIFDFLRRRLSKQELIALQPFLSQFPRM